MTRPTALCASTFLALILAWFVPKHSGLLTGNAASAFEARVAADEDIAFSNKLFMNTEAFVYVAGTLTADWIGYKNNTYSILCLPEQCMVASTAQIGPRQVARIDGPTVYSVARWTDDEVVASANSLCSKTTITIDRQTKTMLWVEAPINQTENACKDADTTVRKATIENSLYWQRSKQNNAN